jgi:hypothetical protein
MARVFPQNARTNPLGEAQFSPDFRIENPQRYQWSLLPSEAIFLVLAHEERVPRPIDPPLQRSIENVLASVTISASRHGP